MTLDKEMFQKLVAELPKILKKLVVPTGRSFVKFNYTEKPDYESTKKEVDSEESMFPAVTVKLQAEYRFHSISGLWDDYVDAQSGYNPKIFTRITDLPSAAKFTTLLSHEAEKLLKENKLFTKNKWNPAVYATLDFQGGEEYCDFIDVCLCVSVLQGS